MAVRAVRFDPAPGGPGLTMAAGSTWRENPTCAPESTVANALTWSPAVTGVAHGAMAARPLLSEVTMVVADPRMTGSEFGLPTTSPTVTDGPLVPDLERMVENVTGAPKTG